VTTRSVGVGLNVVEDVAEGVEDAAGYAKEVGHEELVFEWVESEVGRLRDQVIRFGLF
jgi:hypothetical protein